MNVIEIEKGKYINLDTLEAASLEDIKKFKKKVRLNNQEMEKRFQSKLKCQNEFINAHKTHIVELLGLKENKFDDLSNNDKSYFVYRFSTALYDCFDSGGKERWLCDVKKYMGKQFYYDVIEGYVLGSHDT